MERQNNEFPSKAAAFLFSMETSGHGIPSHPVKHPSTIKLLVVKVHGNPNMQPFFIKQPQPIIVLNISPHLNSVKNYVAQKYLTLPT